MKRGIFFFLLTFIFSGIPPVAFAQSPLAVPAATPVAGNPERVGGGAAAKGTVQLTASGQIGRVATSGPSSQVQLSIRSSSTRN